MACHSLGKFGTCQRPQAPRSSLVPTEEQRRKFSSVDLKRGLHSGLTGAAGIDVERFLVRERPGDWAGAVECFFQRQDLCPQPTPGEPLPGLSVWCWQGVPRLLHTATPGLFSSYTFLGLVGR
ncbi:hypothetical protein H1C71_021218 [Ictidomys tridecemlineatus]|nr:hypothetical protein H1C71_021218 [Ictidomys tridecemlineatus]